MDLHLYVIQGKENVGKTTTCWKLLNLLKPVVECYNYWELPFKGHGVWNPLTDRYEICSDEHTYVVDFIVSARINNQSHCDVAIISAGDEPDFVKDNIYKLLSKGVHHIVCCARSVNKEGSTYHMLQNEFGEFIDERLVEKQCDNAEQDAVANNLLKTIMDL